MASRRPELIRKPHLRSWPADLVRGGPGQRTRPASTTLLRRWRARRRGSRAPWQWPSSPGGCRWKLLSGSSRLRVRLNAGDLRRRQDPLAIGVEQEGGPCVGEKCEPVAPDHVEVAVDIAIALNEGAHVVARSFRRGQRRIHGAHVLL